MRAPPPAQVCGLLASAFLLAFLAVPLLNLLLRGAEGGLWATLSELARDPYMQRRFGIAAGQATLSTLLTVLLGLPGALLFARYTFRGKRLLRAAFTVPFVMPTVVAAVGFLALIGGRGVLGLDLRDTLAIVLVAHVFYNYAIVIRLVGGFLEASAPRLREAAATLGASGWRTELRVTLPLAAPAVLAAAALVFVFCFTSFGVILILAPGAGLDTLEIEIYRLTTRLLRIDTAAMLALVQLAAVLLLSAAYTRMQARVAVPLAQRAPLPRPSGRARWALLAALAPAALLLSSPLVALALRAFWLPGTDGFTLTGVNALLRPSGLIGVADAQLAILNSLRFAAAGGGLALLMGFAFAYAAARGGWGWLDELSLLPLATSAVTLGLGLLITWPGLASRFWGIAVAHALVGFPFVARALLPALRGLPASQLAAAATLGAGPWRRLARVELPLLAPALIGGGGFAFAVSLGEFGATLVLSRPELTTLPLAIFQRLGRPGLQSYAAALVLALLLMLLTAAVMVLLDRLGQSEF